MARSASAPQERAPFARGGLPVRAIGTQTWPRIWNVCAVLLGVGGLIAIDRTAPMAALVLAALMFLLGAPHGGVESEGDTVAPPGLRFSAVYILFGLWIAAIWMIAPPLGLLGFLGLSIWHFGGSDGALKTVGLAVVIGPFAAWPEQTLVIFGTIGGFDTSAPVAPMVRTALSACGIAAITAMLAEATLRGRGLERAVLLAGILLLLSPILSVATFFLFMHASADYRAAARQVGGDIRALTRLYAPTGLPAIMGGVAMVVLFAQGWIDPVWLGAAGAAVAVPHLLYPYWKGLTVTAPAP